MVLDHHSYAEIEASWTTLSASGAVSREAFAQGASTLSDEAVFRLLATPSGEQKRRHLVFKWENAAAALGDSSVELADDAEGALFIGGAHVGWLSALPPPPKGADAQYVPELRARISFEGVRVWNRASAFDWDERAVDGVQEWSVHATLDTTAAKPSGTVTSRPSTAKRCRGSTKGCSGTCSGL